MEAEYLLRMRADLLWLVILDIWKEGETRNIFKKSSNIIERDLFRKGFSFREVLVLRKCTDLHTFQECSIASVLYCIEVRLPNTCLFRFDIGPQFLFIDENAIPHHTTAFKHLLKIEDTQRLNLPVKPPDLNVIEAMGSSNRRSRAAYPSSTPTQLNFLSVLCSLKICFKKQSKLAIINFLFKTFCADQFSNSALNHLYKHSLKMIIRYLFLTNK